MKKIIAALIVLVYALHAAEEHSAKRQKVSHESDLLSFIASNDEVIVAPKNIASLSSYISDIVRAGGDTIDLRPFNVNATTLRYFLNCLKDTMHGIETQKKWAEFPSSFLLQRADGHVIAKNVLPIVAGHMQNIALDDFINVLKLAQFTSVEFLVNALCNIYVTNNYKAKTFADFLDDGQQLIQTFGDFPYQLMKKHAYIQKVLPWPTDATPYEMSIGDYVTLYPQSKLIYGTRLILFDKVLAPHEQTDYPLTKMHITSLDGLHLINLTPIKIINIQSDFIVPITYDPLFPQTPFSTASKVEKIIIKNTRLYTLPEEFLSGAQKLEELNLKNTSLLTLPTNFFEPVAKTIMDILLQDNKITELDKNIFYKPSQSLLVKVYLANNPLCSFKLNDSSFNLKPFEDIEGYRYIDCTMLYS